MSSQGDDSIEGWDDGTGAEFLADPALIASVTVSPVVESGGGGEGLALPPAQPQEHEAPNKEVAARPAALAPQPPPKEKIMYARLPSPRAAKLNVTIGDLDYMRARKRYDIRLPDPKADAEAAAAAAAAATATAAADGGPKDKKANAKANKQAQIEAWASAKVDLLEHYQNCCDILQIMPDAQIVAFVGREPAQKEEPKPLTSLSIDPDGAMPELSEEEQKAKAKAKKKKKNKKNADEGEDASAAGSPESESQRRRPLGAGGARALVSALAGGWVGSTMLPRDKDDTSDGQFVTQKLVENKDSKKKRRIKVKAVGYTYLERLEIRNGNIRTVGAASIGDFLGRSQSASLVNVCLYNCEIGPAGAAALGMALRFGGNRTLQRLSIDCDPTVGNSGVCDLLRGLETNPSLTELSLMCCGFTEEGGNAVASLISSFRSKVQLLHLRGNQIGGNGLSAIANAMVGRTSGKRLVYLNVANIGIDGSHVDALRTFGVAIARTKSLTAINFNYNEIGVDGGEALIDGMGPAKHLEQFLISSGLPARIFAALHRSSGGGKKKKGKKKGKKKKGKEMSGGEGDATAPEIVPDIQKALHWIVAAIAKRRLEMEELEQ